MDEEPVYVPIEIKKLDAAKTSEDVTQGLVKNTIKRLKRATKKKSETVEQILGAQANVKDVSILGGTLDQMELCLH